MGEISAGLLMYVIEEGRLCVLLVHPGGPYWHNKDEGAWSIPKGLPHDGETLLSAARREFHEETGLTAREPFFELSPLKQKSGKIVHCWAFEGARRAVMTGASTFELEWPPRSGRRQSFPEVDDARLFGIDEALKKIITGQGGFITELASLLAKHLNNGDQSQT